MALNINGTTGISGVDGSNANPAIQGTDSNTGLSFGSDILAFNTGGTERSRFDSNGNLLIGNTSFNAGAFGGTAKGINVAGTQPLILLHETDTDKDGYLGIANSQMRLTTADSIPISFATADTERMRIDSSGRLLLGDTSPTTGASTGHLVSTFNGASDIGLKCRDTNGGSINHIVFVSTSNVAGVISGNSSSVSYGTSSDYRLKENVTAISDGITRLKTLKPSRFNFKVDTDTTVDGFLAHEVTAVPEAITGTKDETQDILYTEEDTIPSGKEVGDVKETIPVYQGIDQSKLVPLLTAALQEAVAKIEVLETKVAALEAG